MCACADRGLIGEGMLCIYGFPCLPPKDKTSKTD
jgi:hypothetical protein